ncbi:hydrolase-like motif protein [Ranid herpesvirus 3]|uniref:Hydrolase-like motif protein n=1 Tax=Ranid herpesvirus 3 TaxID=1987509 RepID=A0A1X9T560_9VIRU|nr:hydrolase-like motif protein [Ranid herpesvirus 3]ARR28839.1 hydrolase-like motif protein [Ranid herpesvirus 3]
MYSGSVLELLHTVWSCEVVNADCIGRFIINLCPIQLVTWEGREFDNLVWKDVYDVLCDRGIFETVTDVEEKHINPIAWDNTKFIWLLKGCWIHATELIKLESHDMCGADLADVFTRDHYVSCRDTVFSSKIFLNTFISLKEMFPISAALRVICPLPPCHPLVFAACLRKCLGPAWFFKLIREDCTIRIDQLNNLKDSLSDFTAELVMRCELILPLFQNPGWYTSRTEDAHNNFVRYPETSEMLPAHSGFSTYRWMDRLLFETCRAYFCNLRYWIHILLGMADLDVRNFFIEVMQSISAVYDHCTGTMIYGTCNHYCKSNVLRTLYKFFQMKKYTFSKDSNGSYIISVQSTIAEPENPGEIEHAEDDNTRTEAEASYKEHYAIHPMFAWAVFNRVSILPDIRIHQSIFKYTKT